MFFEADTEEDLMEQFESGEGIGYVLISDQNILAKGTEFHYYDPIEPPFDPVLIFAAAFNYPTENPSVLPPDEESTKWRINIVAEDIRVLQIEYHRPPGTYSYYEGQTWNMILTAATEGDDFFNEPPPPPVN